MSQNQTVLLNGMEVRFCLNEKDTNGVLTMFECIIHAGAKMPVPHYHKDFDETIYGVEGNVSYVVDGKLVEIGPGDSCFIPRGIVHGFSNKTDRTIKFLAVINPGIFGKHCRTQRRYAKARTGARHGIDLYLYQSIFKLFYKA